MVDKRLDPLGVRRCAPWFTHGAADFEMLIGSAPLFKIKVLSLKRNLADPCVLGPSECRTAKTYSQKGPAGAQRYFRLEILSSRLRAIPGKVETGFPCGIAGAAEVGRTMMVRAHPLKGRNRLKLGVFSANADGGLAITDVPERWRAGWQDNLTTAQIADRAGLEFVLPIARWKGFGGKNRVREWSFETFTWAAGLATATEQIGLFMTVHVPLVHPLYAAKSLATVDHISQGRAGLNIVCGWNPKEFDMFGTPLVEKGYDQAAEWLDIVERLYASDEPFDHEGTYYRLKDAVSRPASLQRPRPVTMNAAFGGPGRDFASAKCDYLFTTFSEIAEAGKHVADIGERADKQGRKVGVYTVAHVVCRQTMEEARAYYDRYAVTMADHDAVNAHMAGKKEFSQSHDSDAYDRYRQRFAGGAGTYPLIGTPESIAEEMMAICEQGYQGIALSMVNYTQELPYFCDSVLPLLRSGGYRD